VPAAAARHRTGAAHFLASLRDELQAISPSDVLQVNLDVLGAVATIEASLLRVRELQPRIVTELPVFDLTLLDKLPAYANALLEAHALCQTSGSGNRQGQLFKKAKAVRALLVNDARALAGRKLVSSRMLSGLSGANGYRNVAHDL
jgi:hypothetical protein